MTNLPGNDPILRVKDVRKYYPLEFRWNGTPARQIHAVDGVSFDVARGETLSIVGESGCGKSTIGRAILRLVSVTSGQIILNGRPIDTLSASRMRPLRKQVQVVFQDPFSSLNPRLKVGRILEEPIRNFGLAKGAADVKRRVSELLEMVRLPADAADRWPHEFSGGQRQRVGIARALATEPDLIVCDEAVSALDVSVKAQIVNLLQDLQKRLSLSLLFISHDLAIVEHITTRVGVMYLGRIVEIGPRREIFGSPNHPYTKALMSSVPIPDPQAKREKIILSGDVPSPIDLPSGCKFHTRCPFAFDRCRIEEPKLRQVGSEHLSACHLGDTGIAA